VSTPDADEKTTPAPKAERVVEAVIVMLVKVGLVVTPTVEVEPLATTTMLLPAASVVEPKPGSPIAP
jgi:hypothetical protein